MQIGMAPLKITKNRITFVGFHLHLWAGKGNIVTHIMEDMIAMLFQNLVNILHGKQMNASAMTDGIMFLVISG